MPEKRLVIYYSFDGNTRFIAEAISKETGADILELKLIKERVPRNFTKYLWGGRQVFMKEAPRLLPFDIKAEEYDLLFIGTPVWAFGYAPALRTFFKKVCLKGKRIALFCCSGGAPGNTFKKMQQEMPDNEFLSEIGFVEPLLNKEKNLLKAKDWLSRLNLGA